MTQRFQPEYFPIGQELFGVSFLTRRFYMDHFYRLAFHFALGIIRVAAQTARSHNEICRSNEPTKKPKRTSLRAHGPAGAIALALSAFTVPALAIDVASEADWNTAVAAVAGAGAGSTVSINLTSGLTLTNSLAQLQASNANVTVNITGNGQAINGASSYQGIQVDGANAPTVNISNLAITNTVAHGGNGQNGQNGFFSSSLSYGSGGGGGGGFGAGGGLFVGSGANVTITAVTFTGSSAVGGSGGNGGVAQNGASDPVNGGNGGAGGSANNSGGSGGGGTGGTGGHTGAQGTVGSNATNFGDGGGGGGGSGTTNSTTYTPNNNGGAGNASSGNGGQGGDGVTNNNGSTGPGSDGGSGGNGGRAQGGAIYVATGGTLTTLDSPINGAVATAGAGGSQGVGQGPNSFSGSPGSTGTAQGAGIFINGVTANIGVSGGTVAYADTIDGTGLVINSINTAINKTGAGTLALAATNTFVGNINISGGTVSVAGTANLGNLNNHVTMADGSTFGVTATSIFATGRTFTIAGSSAFDIASGTTTTIQGVISNGASSGSLVKTDTGTLILSAANTYTGQTVVNGGVLKLTGTSSLANSSGASVASGATLDISVLGAQSIGSLAGAGSVLDSATVTVGGSNTSTTFSGVISGAGGLVKTGTGTQTLLGANTYQGATSVNGGTLAVGSDSSLGNAANGLTLSAGTLQAAADLTSARAITISGGSGLNNGGFNATFSGVIGGTDGLTLAGTGTNVLSGANTYTGGTTVNGGTLSIASDSILGDAAGGLTLNAGTLLTTADLTSARGITISNGSTIDTQGHTNAFSGVISGSGGLTLVGGITTLSGVSSYTGTTHVTNAGQLALTNGAALNNSEVAIDSLAEFRADNTTVGGLSNAGNTTVSAGSTLTVAGNLTNTGTLNTSVASTSSYGKINVSGTADLGGTLNVNVLGSPTLSGSLASVIHAGGGITGTFAQVTDNSVLFDFTPVYSGTDVDLTITTPGSGVPATAPDTTVETIVNSYHNNPAVGAARALDAIFASDPNGSLAAVFVPVSSTEAQVNHAVTQTLPLLTGASLITTQDALLGINHVIRSRQDGLRGASSGDGFLAEPNLWVKPFGSRANQDDRNGVAGFDAHIYGLAVGVDGELNDRSRVGIAFAYANANVDGNSSVAPQRLDANIYLLSGYGSYNFGSDTELSYQLDIGKNQNHGVRKMSDFAVEANSNYDSIDAHAGLGLSRTFAINKGLSLTPALHADYTWIRDDSYLETGAGVLDLDVDRRSARQFIPAVDSTLEYRFDNHLAAAVNLGVGYDTLAKRVSITSTYAGAPGVAFDTQGIEPGKLLYRGGVGLNYEATDTLDVSVRYDAEIRTGFDNQTASVKARWKF
jgi:autotransporter-associated beta strand protein